VTKRTDRRLALIAQTLGLGEVPAGPVALAGALGAADPERAYLIISVLRGRIPTATQIEDAVEEWRTEGAQQFVEAELRRSRRGAAPGEVRVESGVIVDVTETATSPYTTGIQRVARESVRRWQGELSLVCWESGSTVLRAADASQVARARGDAAHSRSRAHGEIVIPFRADFILPELAIDERRLEGLRTVATYSGSRMTAIAFDCIPMTTAEAVAPGMAGAFADYLSVLSRFDRLAAISDAAAQEYAGWKRMLHGAGLAGPEIVSLPLPFEAGSVTPEQSRVELRRLGIPSEVPLIVNVGSHEPRKNHVNFLFAAELLWREGHEFAVALLGGNAWETAPFDELVEFLKGRGRSLHIVSRASDAAVWSLYSVARFSVFCSLNEGFGLPVAESLASGTPVITSDFGSMRELAVGNGGLVVDPSDVDALADAMRGLLTDDVRVDELRRETARLEASDWDSYAAAIWEYAVGAPQDAK
jgi:glycosyltransferase involved in cell wall biosynthesis